MATPCNYMENVPVRIVGGYKPPPPPQIPAGLQQKVAMPLEHYQQAFHYDYDFRLEKTVLAHVAERRNVRRMEREKRSERKQRRERRVQQLRELREKEAISNVSYPNDDDLSLTIENGDSTAEYEPEVQLETKDPLLAATRQHADSQLMVDYSHRNILQPTILMPVPVKRNGNNNLPSDQKSYHGEQNDSLLTTASNKCNNFNMVNYEDFESETSPFDNCELKTINDLDVLAQVLHSFQLKTKEKAQLDATAASEVEQHDNISIVNKNLAEEQFCGSKGDTNVINSTKSPSSLAQHSKVTSANAHLSTVHASSNIAYCKLSHPPQELTLPNPQVVINQTDISDTAALS